MKISKDLSRAINELFIDESLLNRFNEFITLTLRKKNKKNYLLSNNYRLITFENTLVKIVEKIIIYYLNLAVKKHELLI